MFPPICGDEKKYVAISGVLLTGYANMNLQTFDL